MPTRLDYSPIPPAPHGALSHRRPGMDSLRMPAVAMRGRAARGPAVDRLRWLTAIRLVLYVVLLTTVAAFYLNGDRNAHPFSLRVVTETLLAAFAATGVYVVWLRSGRALVGLAWTQVVVDQLVWTALVYVSGGPLSGATTFYALSCVFAAIARGFAGALVAGILGFVLFLALVAGLATGYVQPPPDQPMLTLGAGEYAYATLITLLALIVVALLSGYLARRLQLESGRLVEVTERAERAERLAALGQIAAALAHEIRNPLGSISGSIDIIKESPGLEEDERRLCQIIRHEADRLNDLVGDMMNLARPRVPTMEPVDVARVASDVVHLAASSGRGDGDVVVRYEGPDHLRVRGDASQLRQVIWNLVRNAVQASEEGTSVVVRVRPGDHAGAIVEVADHGQGIPTPMKMKIFDAFVTTRSKGVGIGLAVVKQIVDAHQATISVQSAPGEGTTFVVSLPEGRAAS